VVLFPRNPRAQKEPRGRRPPTRLATSTTRSVAPMPRRTSRRRACRTPQARPRSPCRLVANPPRRFGASQADARRPVGGSMSPAGVHPVAEPGPSLSRVKRRPSEVVRDRAPHEGPRAVPGRALDPLRCGLGAPLTDRCLEHAQPLHARSRLPRGSRVLCERGAGRALPRPGHPPRPSPHPTPTPRRASVLHELCCYLNSRARLRRATDPVLPIFTLDPIRIQQRCSRQRSPA